MSCVLFDAGQGLYNGFIRIFSLPENRYLLQLGMRLMSDSSEPVLESNTSHIHEALRGNHRFLWLYYLTSYVEKTRLFKNLHCLPVGFFQNL